MLMPARNGMVAGGETCTFGVAARSDASEPRFCADAVEDFQNLGELDAGGVGIDLGLPARVLHRRAARVVDGALLVLDAVADGPHLEQAGGGNRRDRPR